MMATETRNDIQWLRCIAALEVVVWHSDLIVKHFSGSLVAQSSWQPLGGIGVELFFIVSGYVICMRAPHYRTGLAFLRSRVYRLFPLYWMFTTLVILAFFLNRSWKLHGLELTPDLALRSYLILPQQGQPILGVGWTLEHEMVFYAFVALWMLLPFGMRSRPRIGFGVAMSALGLSGFFYGTGPNGHAWDFHLASPYLLVFAFGWLARLVDELRPGWRGAALLGFFLGVVAVGAGLGDQQENPLALRFGLSAGFFFVVWRAERVFRIDHWINRAAAKIGDASYSLYLSHWFVLSILGKALGTLTLPPSLAIVVRLCGIALCVAVGQALFMWLEKPIDRMLRGGRGKPALHLRRRPAMPGLPSPVTAAER
ncbi:MAG: acyltransferase [Alphaproteobacteria bacterium]|nr:acyltransferase [Alphaproteobacteria bacterium]